LQQRLLDASAPKEFPGVAEVLEARPTWGANGRRGRMSLRPWLTLFVSAVLAAAVGVSAETLVLQPGPEDGKDTYICDCSPDENNPNGPVTHLYQGQYGTCYDRTLIQWDLSALPQGAIVSSAVMELWFNQLWGSESGEMIYYPILEDWEETAVTYTTQPVYSHEDSIVVAWPQVSGYWHPVDVTGFVQMWHGGSLDNYGIYSHCQNTVSTCCAEFNSSDVANANQRPRLTIEYTEQTNAEPERSARSSRLHLGSYPNPFTGRTTVRYELVRPCQVSVDAYDAFGRRVHRLVRGYQEAGCRQTVWDATDLPGGVYVLRLRAGDREITATATLTSGN
jgi:hypothetical protein